jgi:hypothetical protein
MSEKELVAIYKKVLESAYHRAKVFFDDSPTSIGALAEKRMSLPALLDPLRQSTGSTSPELWQAIEAEFDRQFDTVASELTKTSRFREILYEEIYKELKEFYEKEKSWEKLLTIAKHTDEDMYYEVFVRLVEETTNENITSSEHLQKATGLYSLNDVDHIKKEISAPDDWIPTRKVTEAEAEFQMKVFFYIAMRYRYREAIETCLRRGGKYGDLLKISPEDFHLTNEFQPGAMQKAIQTFMYDNSPATNTREVAQKLSAPYSVVLKAKQETEHENYD